jgi:UDP-N-acetylglucosamine 2-epimerase
MKVIKTKTKSNWLPIKINKQILDTVFANAKKSNNKVLAIIPPTKPCFYKLFNVWQEAKKIDLPHILIHSGQHYDGKVGFGMKEFGYDKAFAIDLQIRGDLSQKSSELFFKLKELNIFVRKHWPAIDIVPLVSGDTMSAGIIPLAWVFSTNKKSIHVEAGLRAMSPCFFKGFEEKNNTNIKKFIEKQFNGKWIINRSEPFPEQIDTYIATSACQYFFTPHKLNKEHLIREAYPKKNIFSFGNTVVDVIRLKIREKTEKSIFDLYPKLKNGQWLRVDIHHRGNLTEKRFRAIIGAIIKLVKQGKKIVFVELNSTKIALEHYGLRKKLIELGQKNENFLFTPLWQKYAHVVEFLKSSHCWAVLTDSGSLQEEMNELGKPCLTARFNTDRPETIMYAHSNILIPPISENFIAKVISHIYNDKKLREKMSKGKKLYGKNVSQKIIAKIKSLFKNNAPLFEWAHEELGVYRERGKEFLYL